MEELKVSEPKFITEGLARVYEEGNVFYNPVQEVRVNRNFYVRQFSIS